MPVLEFWKIEIYVGNPHVGSIILTTTSQIYKSWSLHDSNSTKTRARITQNQKDYRNRKLNHKHRLGLRLHGIGYIQIYLGIRSTMHGTDPLCLHGTCKKQERHGYIWDNLHNWTHLVPDSRSDPYCIHQVPCKNKAYPYQFRTGSRRIRSRVNTASVHTLR